MMYEISFRILYISFQIYLSLLTEGLSFLLSFLWESNHDVWLQRASARKSVSDICLCNPQEAIPKHPWEETQRIRLTF